MRIDFARKKSVRDLNGPWCFCGISQILGLMPQGGYNLQVPDGIRRTRSIPKKYHSMQTSATGKLLVYRGLRFNDIAQFAIHICAFAYQSPSSPPIHDEDGIEFFRGYPAKLHLARLESQRGPTIVQPVIRQQRDTGDRELVMMRWGDLPQVANSPPKSIFPGTLFCVHKRRMGLYIFAPLYQLTVHSHPNFRKDIKAVQSDLNPENDSTEFEKYIMDIDEDDSEISGDCNESQPCRGDEAWLPQDLDPWQ